MEKVKIFLAFLFLIGFLIRFFPVRSDTSFHYWDEAIYLQHAEILGGYREDNYNEFDFRPPLLPVMIALGYKVYPSVVTAHFIVALIASLGIISTFFLTKILFKDKKVSLIAAIIFAFIPIHVILSHSILVDSMLPTLWSFTILFLLLAMEKNKMFLFFVSGIMLGLSVLLKFTSILLVLYVIILFLCKKFEKRKLTLKVIFTVFLSFFLTILPHLIFSRITFNSFLHPFIMAYTVVNWDVPTPWHIFYTQFFDLFPPFFSFGILIYFFRKINERKFSREEYITMIYIMIPFVFFQLLIHKEIRLLIPTLPFLSIISAIGFSYIQKKKSKIIVTIALISLAIYFYGLVSHDMGMVIENLNKKPAIMEAALWINQTAPKDIIVYNNFQFAPLAYYSMRRIQLLPFTRSFQNEIESVMTKFGYVVVSSLTHKEKEPTLDFLMNDGRFKLLKTFEDETEKIYVFEYIPRAT